jgi:mycothiol system anti-sigma-R factor
MSCGRPHEIPCTEVLERVHSYLDGELDAPDIAKVRQHLDECEPCLKEYGLDQLVKKLVNKHCGHDRPPEALRAKVLIRIEQVQAELRISQSSPE